MNLSCTFFAPNPILAADLLGQERPPSLRVRLLSTQREHDQVRPGLRPHHPRLREPRGVLFGVSHLPRETSQRQVHQCCAQRLRARHQDAMARPLRGSYEAC